MIRFKEDLPKPDSQWRGGCNKCVADLGEKMAVLLADELGNAGVSLSTLPNDDPRLVTTRSYNAGELICPLAALHYDDPKELEAFFAAAESAALLQEPRARCSGVLPASPQDGQEASPPVAIHSVFMGVGRYLRHYRGVRGKGPNATIQVNVAAGANDDFLKLVVATGSQNGIAKGRGVDRCTHGTTTRDWLMTRDWFT